MENCMALFLHISSCNERVKNHAHIANLFVCLYLISSPVSGYVADPA